MAALAILAALAAAAGLWRLWSFSAFSPGPPEAPGPALVSGLPESPGAPGRPLRVLLMGTSLTARGDWPKRLEARLAACLPDGAETRVLARPGAASPWGAAMMEKALTAFAGAPPDLLMIEFTINDASLWRGVSLARAKALLQDMLEAAAAAHVPVILATMNPAWGRKGWERPGQRAYRALYREAAKEGRAALLDTIPAWLALSQEERRRLAPDGLHPGEEGMALAVEAFSRGVCPG